jgi:hypothetical protein
MREKIHDEIEVLRWLAARLMSLFMICPLMSADRWARGAEFNEPDVVVSWTRMSKRRLYCSIKGWKLPQA